MTNEQLKRLYPIVCLVAVFMSFMFFFSRSINQNMSQ